MSVHFSRMLPAVAAIALAAAAPPPSPSVDQITAAIAAERLPLERETAGGFTGAGWQRLVDDAATAQFMMVGEQHGSGSIAEFEAQLHKALAARGYTHSALEVGPYSTDFAERLIRGGPGRLQAYIAAPGHGFTLPFLFFGEEAAMAEQMVRLSPDRRHPLWGLDQEFIGGGPLHADLLEAYAKSAEQKSAVAVFRSAASNNPMHSGVVSEAELAPLRSAFAANPDALEVIKALAASAAIYRPFVVKGGGDIYSANLARETMMKRNFLAAFEAAEKRGKRPPKVFLKFGGNHAMRGFSDTNVPALGNFIAEWGNARNLRLVNLFVECDGGQALNPQTNAPAPCEPYFAEDSLLRRAVQSGPPLQIYDLRPLRAQLSKWKNADASTKKVILAFDYYVTIRDGRAATPVGTPPGVLGKK